MLTLLAALCLGLSWLVPNHYPPWSSFYNELLAGVSLLLFAVALKAKWKEGDIPTISWVVLACAVIPLVQWQVGLLRFSGDFWISGLYIVGFAAAIATGYKLAKVDRSAISIVLASTVLCGALFSGGLAIAQGLQFKGLGIWMLDPIPNMRAYANLAQPNNLATLLGMGVLSLFLLLQYRRLPLFVSIAALTTLIVAAAMTQSRTALLYGPLICLGAVWGRRRGLDLRFRCAIGVAAIAGHWLLTFTWPFISNALSVSIGAEARGVDSIRFQMWPLLISALNRSPWVGFGTLQVGEAELLSVSNFPPVGELWLHGHNLFLELMIWTGYPLGLGLSFAIVFWASSRIRRVSTVESLTAGMMVGVFIVHAMLEFPYHYAYLLIPIGLWIGILESELPTRFPGSPYLGLFPLLISAALFVAVIKDYRGIEDDFRLMRFQSIRVAPMSSDLTTRAPFLSTLQGYLEFARTRIRPGMGEAEIEQMEAVVKRYPYSTAIERLAMAWSLNGRKLESAQMLRTIKHIYGDVAYQRVLLSLRERATDGDPGPAALLEAMAD